MNPATDVSALRHNNVPVKCSFVGITDNGSKVYRYRLAEFFA